MWRLKATTLDEQVEVERNNLKLEKWNFHWKLRSYEKKICRIQLWRLLTSSYFSYAPKALRALSSDTQNPFLSVCDLSILFLQTPHINNAQSHSSLSPMKTKLSCSTLRNPTIRDMPFPIPNAPLNFSPFSISTSKEQHVGAPPEISAFKGGAVKSQKHLAGWIHLKKQSLEETTEECFCSFEKCRNNSTRTGLFSVVGVTLCICHQSLPDRKLLSIVCLVE